MKVGNHILIFTLLFIQIYTLSYIQKHTLHLNHELPKVCFLDDGGVVALSSLRGTKQETKMSRLDRDANDIFTNSLMDFSYTGSSQFIKLKNSVNYALYYHNSQDREKQEAKEKIIVFEDKGKVLNETTKKLSLFKTKSAVALKNGKIFLAGIRPVSDYEQTKIELDLYNPETDELENGLTFEAYSNFISCYEQRENDVYCVYTSFEDVYVTKLKIKHIYVNENTLYVKNEKVIKTFYIEFNFLKAVSFNDNEALILFQTGNPKKDGNTPFGNTGKDLFFYHIELSKTDFVTVKRYEYLYNDCKYEENAEYYNADIFPLSQRRIYAVCEATTDNVLKGFEIDPIEKSVIRFDINFDSSKAKTPVFTKFDKTLGLFYNDVSHSEVSTISYFLINYPDCNDIKYPDGQSYLLPKHFYKEFDFKGKVYMSNPLPANRGKEEIYFRIIENPNMKILKIEKKGKEELLYNSDYKDESTLQFIANSLEGEYTLDFVSTRNDVKDGLIMGKTCKIFLNTPKCLPQCYSCTKTGNEEHHYCLGCEEGPYYEENDDTAQNEGYGKPHNCHKCDKACKKCKGKATSKTTFCEACDIENGFYPYYKDHSLCISYETQEYWETVLNISIYLDSTPDNDKNQWRWRDCHRNCKKCHRAGTDENNQCDVCIDDYYFYCSQTIGNGGIPGSCHNDCVNNGYFLKKNASDNMDKCCPCLDNCLLCYNETKCEECNQSFYKTPDWDMCNKTCDPCTAYDDDLKECVYCKSRYEKTKESPRYNLNQRCIYPMPDHYHLIDEECYYITTCDDSCFTCDPVGSAKCTKCNSSYYKQDFFGLTPKKTFRCFSENQCKGIEEYPPEKDYRVGGVPIKENGEGVCLNCKLRNNSFRLPEDQFYCDNVKPNKTFVDIEEYNKLTKCYLRCKTCDSWGNACFMNCTSCLDSSLYDFLVYDHNNNHGNCFRKKHKCGIYPYYHDYDLYAFVGKEEDNCGQDCDVCLYNFTCPSHVPFINFETHECVEYCTITKVLGNECGFNYTEAYYKLLMDPFGTRNLYDPINNYVNIKQLISTDFGKYLFNTYDIDYNTVENTINNYLGTGKIFNLPESKIIFGNNISISFTTTKLEEQKIVDIMKGDETAQTNTSVIDLSKCEALLKKKYGIPDEEDLMIIKGDEWGNLTDLYFGNKVDYLLFSISLGAFLPLSDCEKDDSSNTVVVTNPFNPQDLITSFQSKIGAVVSNGYDVFDAESPFYNDVCSPFTNENGNDVLLEERRSDYFNENLNICENGCTFVSYNTTLKMYTCKCPIKTKINQTIENVEYEEVTKEFPESFYKRHKHSNIEVFKCGSQVFSASGQKKNIGSVCLLACLGSFIGVVVFYFIKGKEGVNLLFNGLISPASPPHPKIPNKEKENYDDLVKKPKKPVKVEKDIVLLDEELNSVSFEIASRQDYRGYLRYYWSLLKLKQLFIFTFYTYKDHNLRIAKIVLFILFISFYFAFTALFFNDNIMRQIYIYKGNTNAAIHIPNIILSSLCCLIMNFIVRFVSLSDRDINKIKCEKNLENRKALCKQAKKALKIKLYILFAVSAILIILCWYYVAAFCAVFKNSQGHYFINLAVSFIVCNIWPCVTSLIPPIFRIQSLKSGSECMYKFSQIIAYI